MIPRVQFAKHTPDIPAVISCLSNARELITNKQRLLIAIMLSTPVGFSSPTPNTKNIQERPITRSP